MNCRCRDKECGIKNDECRMNQHTQIIHGGSDATNGDFSLVHRLARTKEDSSHWGCGKKTKKGDILLIYFEQPHSAIVASAVALNDAKPGKDYLYETSVGKFRILPSPITLAEMKETFPRWKWLNYPRAKQYLDRTKAAALLKRAAFKLRTPPVAIKISGAGFGKPEQNRLVEKAACGEVRKHFVKRGYEVVSREKENVGYDFDVKKKDELIHVEVKGISGSVLKFPITANEVACSQTDKKFKLAVVTEATTPKREVHIFEAKVFLKNFELTPLAFFAEAKENLHMR